MASARKQSCRHNPAGTSNPFMKIRFGPEPNDPSRRDFKLDLSQFAAVVNVSDTPCRLFAEAQPAPYFWFPIHECVFWGYAPFFGTAKVYDNYRDTGKAMYVHCHAGACRSPIMAYTILRAEGKTEADMVKDFPRYAGIERMFDLHVDRGCIPEDIIPFLQARHLHPTYSIGGLLGVIKSPNLFIPTFSKPKGTRWQQGLNSPSTSTPIT